MKIFSYFLCFLSITESFHLKNTETRSFRLNTLPIREPFNSNQIRRFLFIAGMLYIYKAYFSNILMQIIIKPKRLLLD